ncbi:hypothetical protein DL93DRAFT_2092178 [Clavulina sp. PMI_390]|nr:hypothetical protein DL93DRAFT_2092178 [Clavulina sp. PMI_390]
MSDAGTSNSRARRMGKVKSLDGCWTCRISKKVCPKSHDDRTYSIHWYFTALPLRT